MARGWESKSVEDQITEKFSGRAPAFLPPTALDQERESLLLQQKRIQLAIDSSTNPRYIEQQNKALAFIAQQLQNVAKNSR